MATEELTLQTWAFKPSFGGNWTFISSLKLIPNFRISTVRLFHDRPPLRKGTEDLPVSLTSITKIKDAPTHPECLQCSISPFFLRVVQYSQIDFLGVSGDKKGLHWCLAYRTRNINNNYSALLLGPKANLFCTNRTIGIIFE